MFPLLIDLMFLMVIYQQQSHGLKVFEFVESELKNNINNLMKMS